MATEQKLADDRLIVLMSDLLMKVDGLPKTAPSKDLAMALTQIGELEKALRKTRVGWMAALIKQAGQGSLLA